MIQQTGTSMPARTQSTNVATNCPASQHQKLTQRALFTNNVADRFRMNWQLAQTGNLLPSISHKICCPSLYNGLVLLSSRAATLAPSFVNACTHSTLPFSAPPRSNKHKPCKRLEMRKLTMTARTSSALLFIDWLAVAPAALAQKVDILALGASNTYGEGVSRGQSYPAHLQRQLQSRCVNTRVRNAGINGNTTGQMLARLSSVLLRNTRIVILQPGGNDRRRGISRQSRRHNVRAISQNYALPVLKS
jgi:hypothetical protein